MAKCPKCGTESQTNEKDLASTSIIRCHNCGKLFETGFGITQKPSNQPQPRPAPHPEPATSPPPVVSISISGHTVGMLLSGSSASFCLLALIFFFLPWLKISCAGNEVATQSGLQIATGKFSKNETFGMPKNQGVPPELGEQYKATPSSTATTEKPEIDADYLLFIFPLGLLLSGLAALPVAVGKNTKPGWAPAIGASIALATLLVYVITGFSAERQIDMDNALQGVKSEQAQQSPDDPFAQMGDQMAKQMVKDTFKIQYTGIFFATLVFTIIAFLSGLGLTRIKQPSIT